MPTIATAASPGMPTLLMVAIHPAAQLAVQLAVVAVAAYAGGSSAAFLALGHRRMQVLLSLTGGVLLGVGLLHLLPHAFLQLDRQIDATAGWMVAGFFLMFLLERAFHGHAHHTADGVDTGGGCAPAEARGHGHAHGADHPHHHHDGHGHASPGTGRWAWCGAFAGLSLHSLADGAALAASVRADGDHGVGWLAGIATFLAVLLHKPFDAAIIGTLMINAKAPPRMRRLVNAAYACIVPLGAAAFLGSLRLFGHQHDTIVGVALALAAGAFLCIAAADLLPEVQFHSHDRVLLTASLALGLAIAWGISAVERSAHSHSHRPGTEHVHPRAHDRPHDQADREPPVPLRAPGATPSER